MLRATPRSERGGQRCLGRRTAPLLVLFFRHQQFGGDHEQREPPSQLEVGQFHLDQRRDDTRKDDAENDCSSRA